jgi:hypothetical protein
VISRCVTADRSARPELQAPIRDPARLAWHEGKKVAHYWLEVIPKSCKRLAEVDFPIAAVSKHAAREKSIRHGHPSTLHLWRARRPLARFDPKLVRMAAGHERAED